METVRIENLLTTAEISAAIAKFTSNQSVRLISVSSAPISDKLIGYLGNHSRITVTYSGADNESNQELQLFLKTQHELDNLVADYFPEMFDKEATTYRYFAHAATTLDLDASVLPFPRLLHSKRETKTLLMEHLQLRGYFMHDSLLLDRDHVLVCLKSLARLHAMSVLCEAKAGFSIRQQYHEGLYEVIFSSVEGTNGNKYCLAGLTGVCAIVDCLYGDDKDGIADRLKVEIMKIGREMLEYMTNPRDGALNVYCHGDLWARNMMFSYADEINTRPVDCRLVDYQFVRYAPPTHDVSMAIYHTTDSATLAAHCEELIAEYYRYLGDALDDWNGPPVQDVFPWDVYRASLELNLRYSKIIKGIYRSYSTIPERDLLSLQRDRAFYDDVVFGDRSAICRKYFREDANYRHVMTEIVHDLRSILLSEPSS